MARAQRWLEVFAIILSIASLTVGQTAAGTGGTRIKADGFSFTAPAGWKFKQDQGWGLVSPTGDSIVLVSAHRYNDFESALRDTKLDAGEVAGTPRDLKNGGKTVRVAKRTAQGIAVIDLFILFSPHGGGALVVALSEGKNSDASFYAGMDISNSVRFDPRASAPPPPARSGWAARLSGKHLLYLYSGNGYFEEKHIYLCSSGTFYQTTGSGGFTPHDSDGGSFAARGGKRGRWSVSGNVLSLQFQDGTGGEYSLTERSAGNEIGMNGRRYFVQSNANCN